MDLSEVEKQAQIAIARLWELIRTVEDRGNSPDMKAKTEQLRVITHSIHRLEKRHVPVPEDLRRLKLSLHMEVHPEEDMARFQSTLTREVDKLASHLRAPARTVKSHAKSKSQQSRLPSTPQSAFREHIIAALKSHGGKAHCHAVYDWVEKQFKGKFLPGDITRRKCGELVWKNNVAWQRMALVTEGVLKKHSPRGIWELQEGRQ